MWKKKGVIISPQNNLWWMKTHAMLPTVRHVEDNKYIVYYSGRDENNVSHIGASEIAIDGDNIKVISYSTEPVFSIGERGCFDDNGVTPSCMLQDKLYYIGWNSGTTTYRMSLIMGLAIKKDGDIKRHSRAPLFQKTDKEPYGILTAPWVIFDDNKYKMWYVSGEGWINKNLPKYNIKYAVSDDGINWQRNADVAIELQGKETALARPNVLKTANGYEMFFSYKDPEKTYRIGRATSEDGKLWLRDKKEVLGVSTEGWDSEMVAYPCVFKHNNKKYMLYNGNGYGLTGVGYAVEE